MLVKNGDTVRVSYIGTLKDGTIFDSNEGNQKSALEFKVGSGQLIKGFDDAVIGMKVGDTKTINLKPEEAYGERRDELIQQIPTKQLPEGVEVSSVLTVRVQNGQTMDAIVIDKKDDYSTLDLNHPLAGHELNFKITIVEIT